MDGLDGGYVRDWNQRKTNFELIVGRSMPEDRESRYVGMVHGYDTKPKRRLFDLLKTQGLQANQDVTFLTEGGEEVRSLTERVTPTSEHVLDWFHIAMRLTVLERSNSTRVAPPITIKPKGKACSRRSAGSSGCCGTATSIELSRRLEISETMRSRWKWTTST